MGLGRESSSASDSAPVSWEQVPASGVSNHFASRIKPNSSPVARRAPSMRCERPTLEDSGSPRSLLSEFTSAWERGLAHSVDTYLDRLDPADFRGAVELVYREFCLLEAAGRKPDVSQYLRRFPGYAEALERLLGLHDVCSPSLLKHWVMLPLVTEHLPIAGYEVGPYFLRRELGRGSFARVFLAEQVNLENRLVVVKVATRLTREPWLLARVRHPHIVEVVSHAIVEDCGFHLICMPFLGGATLSAILAERRRSWPGASGGELLADLDAVAAPEFPTSQAAHPAREILRALTYDQALAWIGSRLADALDHAFSKEVAHGDVKPSNILLAADGSPMLLDFNLARDGSPLGSNDPVGEPGGTLAYMAPERLWALAATAPVRAELEASRKIASGIASSPVSSRGSLLGKKRADYCAHRADIYSLGVVLLEALTRRTSEASSLRPAIAPNAQSSSLESAAKVYAKSRTRSARVLVDEAEANGGRTIPAGLRAVLEHALDPAPLHRYQRARDFAEDLDRWRSNRPLAFAAEPLWRYTIPSWIRRRKRVLLVAAAAFSLVLGLPTTTLLILNAQRTQEEIARNKLNRYWGDAQAYRFRPMTSDWLGDPSRSSASFRLTDPGDPKALESARRALEDFGVFGPGDWRRSQDFSHLPRDKREDLELWLMELAYRYCLALAERPDSRQDWERALFLLEHIAEANPSPVFTTLFARLNAKLAPVESVATISKRLQIQSGPKFGPPAHSAPACLSEYLLGVSVECEFELSDDQTRQWPDNPLEPGSAPMGPTLRGRQAAANALEHYRKLLAIRPQSYWGNYRAAGVCYVLGAFAESAQHLDRCLAIRPDNAAVRGQRAACLAWIERYSEALEECDRALDRAPDLPELYRTRAFIRAASGLTSGLAADVQHFELLSRLLPRQFLDHVPTIEPSEPELAQTTTSDRLAELLTGLGLHGSSAIRPGLSGGTQILTVDPDELITRLALASKIQNAGDPELASTEYAKVLMLDPDHIPARTIRALEEIKNKRFEQAHHDLELVLNHPHLMEYLRRNPPFWRFLLQASRQLSLTGRAEEGRAIARRVLDFANVLNRFKGDSHYNLACAYGVSARSDPQFVPLATNELWQAFAAHPLNQDHYLRDPAFDPVRSRIDQEYRRLVAARPGQSN
jgi:eukaryotic-like serine/threonine-protein kinase